ncbi:MAG: MarR family transcriptional regulator [Clostridia bacterium]|nr:MarR family transcriptional regulator [Clostridia bacterium]MBQ6906301.1 MarR family transcriptional regulator [Clostridia bacterium]
MDENNVLLQKEMKIGFPLYVASRELARLYRDLLLDFDLTYTQYLTMVMLFDIDVVNVKELGKMLYLDSGTLTPLLIKLEKKGYLTRTRLADDNRYLNISLTEKGKALKPELEKVGDKILKMLDVTDTESQCLESLLQKIMKCKE